MKKIFKLFILCLFMLLPLLSVDAKENEKVTIHVFYAEWCPNCINLHEFLDELEEDKEYNDMFEIVYYRLDNEKQYGENKDFKSNNELYYKVSAYFEYSDNGIPLYVIGDNYKSGYSQTNSPAMIKNLVREEYFNKNYKDVVKEIKNNKIKVETTTTATSKTEKEDDGDSNITRSETNIETKNRKVTTYIGIGVIAVTLLVVIVIVFVSMKRN